VGKLGRGLDATCVLAMEVNVTLSGRGGVVLRPDSRPAYIRLTETLELGSNSVKKSDVLSSTIRGIHDSEEKS
jgi:hypothetical protein